MRIALTYAALNGLGVKAQEFAFGIVETNLVVTFLVVWFDVARPERQCDAS